MDLLIIVLGCMLFLVSYLGAIHPAIPGPFVAVGAYWLVSLHSESDISSKYIVIVALISVLVFVVDFIVPARISQRFGGSKAASHGALIGTVIGMVFMPLGFISLFVGPMLGAFIGELTICNDMKRAFKISIGALIGFLFGSGLKLSFAMVVTYFAFAHIF